VVSIISLQRCSVVCMILRVAIVVQHWFVTDKEINRGTRDDSIYYKARAKITSDVEKSSVF